MNRAKVSRQRLGKRSGNGASPQPGKRVRAAIRYNDPLSSTLPLWIPALLACAGAYPVLLWLLARQPHGATRVLLITCLICLGLGAPWVAPLDLPWLRFFLTVPGFAVIGKTTELIHERVDLPAVMTSKSRFLA